jgi:hypothetical protein
MQAKTAIALRYEVIQDKMASGFWRVEAIDTTCGDVFVAIFSGPLAEDRAKEYAAFKNKPS